MTAYYNEHDEFAAAWLRNLIAANMIAPGDVDERSIEDVVPLDLAKYTQCHFFAGIGVWSYSMRRAGWADSRRAWTGSCPCQPFSAAGQGAGFADERHLWPAFFHLIDQCGPDVVFGEQVASKDGLAWLDLVQSDMEAANYAFGALVTPAAGYGAPHIRHRTYWMAHASVRGCEPREGHGGIRRADDGTRPTSVEPGTQNALGGVAHQPSNRREQWRPEPGRGRVVVSSSVGGLGVTNSTGLQPRGSGSATMGHGSSVDAASSVGAGCGPVNNVWSAADWLRCKDERWRPVEPGTFPLANGAVNRVGLLRGYGNAIVAPQAEEFIRVAMEYAP